MNSDKGAQTQDLRPTVGKNRRRPISSIHVSLCRNTYPCTGIIGSHSITTSLRSKGKESTPVAQGPAERVKLAGVAVAVVHTGSLCPGRPPGVPSPGQVPTPAPWPRSGGVTGRQGRQAVHPSGHPAAAHFPTSGRTFHCCSG